jgi:hypothetical protein
MHCGLQEKGKNVKTNGKKGTLVHTNFFTVRLTTKISL